MTIISKKLPVLLFESKVKIAVLSTQVCFEVYESLTKLIVIEFFVIVTFISFELSLQNALLFVYINLFWKKFWKPGSGKRCEFVCVCVFLPFSKLARNFGGLRELFTIFKYILLFLISFLNLLHGYTIFSSFYFFFLLKKLHYFCVVLSEKI